MRAYGCMWVHTTYGCIWMHIMYTSWMHMHAHWCKMDAYIVYLVFLRYVDMYMYMYIYTYIWMYRERERERERERARERERDISKVESQLPSCQPYMHDNHSNFILFSNLFDLFFVFLQFSPILDPKRTPKGPQKDPPGDLKKQRSSGPSFCSKTTPLGTPPNITFRSWKRCNYCRFET